MNCKEAEVKLCWTCEQGLVDGLMHCNITQNEDFFQEVLKNNEDLKSQLIDDLKNNNLSHIHIAATLKLYHPEYYDWFQKMLLLK